jgi:flagellar biosynthesis protein FlhB
MSGDDSKTEKPTDKRLQDAREMGQVAKSNDLNGAVVLTAAVLLMSYYGPAAFQTLYSMAHEVFEKPYKGPMTVSALNIIISGALQSALLLMVPFFLTICTMAVLTNIVQIKPLWSMKALMPKWDKINPVSGSKRLFSMRSVVESGKALIKMTIIGTSGSIIISNHQQELLTLSQTHLRTASHVILSILGEISLWVCVLFLVMGLVDFFYQRYELEKSLRMSRQDIRDERKNLDGDPAMKHKIRHMGAQMLKKRQLSAIKTADVIVTNPTHYAVALKYDPDLYPAPHVVAKGVDHFAMKIREIAKAANVPLVENRPLAQSLYKTVDINAMIPPDLFVAVAEVLAYVFSKNKRRPKPTAPKDPR